jgi:hypothetical protein
MRELERWSGQAVTLANSTYHDLPPSASMLQPDIEKAKVKENNNLLTKQPQLSCVLQNDKRAPNEMPSVEVWVYKYALRSRPKLRK